jgi:hypothetical protein
MQAMPVFSVVGSNLYAISLTFGLEPCTSAADPEVRLRCDQGSLSTRSREPDNGADAMDTQSVMFAECVLDLHSSRSYRGRFSPRFVECTFWYRGRA